MDKRTVPKAIRGFVAAIRRRFRPQRIILFGSRARGEAGEESDYDILIISDVFEGIPEVDRGADVYDFHPGTVSLDVLCLTPQEYEERRHGANIVTVVAREGVELVG